MIQILIGHLLCARRFPRGWSVVVNKTEFLPHEIGIWWMEMNFGNDRWVHLRVFRESKSQVCVWRERNERFQPTVSSKLIHLSLFTIWPCSPVQPSLYCSLLSTSSAPTPLNNVPVSEGTKLPSLPCPCLSCPLCLEYAFFSFLPGVQLANASLGSLLGLLLIWLNPPSDPTLLSMHLPD